MSSIASKNLYELLGNDPELDPDRAPEPPTKVIDKPVQRTGKRNAGAEGPSRDDPRPSAGGRGGRQTVLNSADQAGALNNRAEQRDDGLRADRQTNRVRGADSRESRDGRYRGRGRGGRGGRGGAPRDDRHSHTGIGEHDKQAAHGWGGETGTAEWADERAGDAIARAEVSNDAGLSADSKAADPAFGDGPGGDGEVVGEPEPEDKTKSYDQYLAEQAEKRLALGGGSLETRKANEGSSQKFPEGKAFSRDPEAENFFIGSGGKARKVKDTQDKKERVTIDQQYYAAPDSGDRGGRGGRGRGSRGGSRGEFRGGERGRGRGGRGRDDFRGGAAAPRGDRGDRGGRGGFNATDQSAFPALGGS